MDPGRQAVHANERVKRKKNAAKPGVHYAAVESEAEPPEFFLIPEAPAHVFSSFRHSRALVRK